VLITNQLKILTLALLVGCLQCQYAQAGSAQQLFSEYHDQIYQVRLIELASGSKSSIGSAFQINPDGLLATNFHVVADAVHKPEKYRVEYINHEGKKGELQILDIDVVHDLALLKHQDGFNKYFRFANKPLQQGEEVFSLGNPRDLGMTVVPGTYNGLLAHSYYDRILFSGSLNPGMSGGPALNAGGEVIGVNVATSGNQLSFLVPLQELNNLVSSYMRSQGEYVGDFKKKIEQQLKENQKKQLTELIDAEWPQSTLGEAQIVGEMTRFTRCWGGSSEEEKKALYEHTYNQCFSESDIYLSSHFSTGAINYEFYWLESAQLNAKQFYARYKSSVEGAGPVNRGATEEDVGNFECNTEFVDQPRKNQRPLVWKNIICARPYKQYEGLYDLVFIGATLSDHHRGLISHFALSGVTKELGMRFTQKFLERVVWK